eukprot:6937042-Pyramimonas_sp.AAC.1
MPIVKLPLFGARLPPARGGGLLLKTLGNRRWRARALHHGCSDVPVRARLKSLEARVGLRLRAEASRPNMRAAGEGRRWDGGLAGGRLKLSRLSIAALGKTTKRDNDFSQPH